MTPKSGNWPYKQMVADGIMGMLIMMIVASGVFLIGNTWLYLWCSVPAAATVLVVVLALFGVTFWAIS